MRLLRLRRGRARVRPRVLVQHDGRLRQQHVPLRLGRQLQLRLLRAAMPRRVRQRLLVQRDVLERHVYLRRGRFLHVLVRRPPLPRLVCGLEPDLRRRVRRRAVHLRRGQRLPLRLPERALPHDVQRRLAVRGRLPAGHRRDAELRHPELPRGGRHLSGRKRRRVRRALPHGLIASAGCPRPAPTAVLLAPSPHATPARAPRTPPGPVRHP